MSLKCQTDSMYEYDHIQLLTYATFLVLQHIEVISNGGNNIFISKFDPGLKSLVHTEYVWYS
jgi:hypothetical protein